MIDLKPVDLNIYDNFFAVILIWILVYCLDYFLTILGARWYAQGVNQFIDYEGSYELTPAFQQDVDRQRWFSLRFLFYIVLSVIILAVFWSLDAWLLQGSGLFPLLIGALFLREAAILQRHLRSLFTYFAVRNANGLEGRLVYRRWLILQSSGAELLIAALLFFFLFALYGSWFLLGGILACLVTGIQHLVWGFRAKRQATQ